MAKKKKWNDINYVKVYSYTRDGMTKSQVCKMLNISVETLDRWCDQNPVLAEALEMGRKHRKSGRIAEFARVAMKRLPPDAQDVWLKMSAWENEEEGCEMLYEMLGDRGINVKKTLFVHSLIANTFHIAKACQDIGIPRRVYDQWMLDDEFAEMVREAYYVYKDHCRSRLFDLVEEGDPAAILFVNKTMNKDYGFGEEINVNVNGSIDHTHTVDITSLDLPLDVKKMILEALEKQKGVAFTDSKNIIDVESVTRKKNGNRKNGKAVRRRIEKNLAINN